VGLLEKCWGNFLAALLVVGESLLAFKRVAEFGGKVVGLFDKNGKLVRVLYNASKDVQNKVEGQQGESQNGGSGGSGGTGGEDPGDPDERKKLDGNFKTLKEFKHAFDNKSMKGSRAMKNKRDGSVWEKDMSSHGGKQFKR
jgi:hypothetical protein